MPHTSARAVRSSAPCGGRSGRENSLISTGWRGAGITAARMRASTAVRYSVDVHSRISFLAALMLCAGSSLASAQTYEVQKPRKHFVSFSYDWIYTEPLHFAEHPLSDLVGRAVTPTQREDYEYRTKDDATLIDVIEFSRRQIGLGASIYPLGMSSGPTLMLRGKHRAAAADPARVPWGRRRFRVTRCSMDVRTTAPSA